MLRNVSSLFLYQFLPWAYTVPSPFDYEQVTFIEALDGLMPGFDPEIGKLAQRILINPRKIDYHVGVLAKKVRDSRCQVLISFGVCIILFFFAVILSNSTVCWRCEQLSHLAPPL